MSQVVIFGNGMYADVVFHCLKQDSPHEVVAFTADAEFLESDTILGLPAVPFERVEEHYPPGQHMMFIAVGYQDLNALRARKCKEAKQKGYRLASYVSSRASNVAGVPIGENCLVLENSSIQPGAQIGDNVTVWSNNSIGHHSTIGSHSYIAGNCMVAGKTTIGESCFLGVGCTVGHGVAVGARSVIGAGALITVDAGEGAVFIAQSTEKYRLDSTDFLRLTRF